MNFLRNLLASILGTLVALGIFFFMFFVMMAAIGSAEDGPKVKSNSVLDLTYTGLIQDYAPGDSDDPFSAFGTPAMDFVNLMNALQAAREDDRISGIRMNTSFFLGGWTQADDVRRALEDFRESGKFVYAYGDMFSQKDYYIATAADSIFLNPTGMLDLKGLGSEVLFYKDLQDKSGVKMEVIRLGEYKSAVEPFLSSEMSAENREQIGELLGSIWSHISTQMADSRGLDLDDLNRITDTLGGRFPEYALENGLIDGILYQDQSDSLIRVRMGLAAEKKFNTIALRDYMKVAPANKGSLKNQIAVLHAQGEIIYGKGDQNQLGQGAFNSALRRAVKDERVKAIVVRVNSPGGSALTSELIWRELEKAKEKKPVIASFGDVAASGGYYIAAGADKIYAEPNSITGSIGVFGVVPNMAKLADNIGINAEQVGTHRQSVGYSIFDPMSGDFRAMLQESIGKTYETFLTRVSEGRGISMAEADRVARGRVWSGTKAKELGLVDEIGTLDDAVAAAAEAAGVQDYRVVRYPRYKTGLDKLLEELGNAEARIGERVIENELGPELYGTYKATRELRNLEGIQVRLPYHLTIE